MLKRLALSICPLALLSGFALAQNIADDTSNARAERERIPFYKGHSIITLGQGREKG